MIAIDDKGHAQWLTEYDDYIQRTVGVPTTTRQRYATIVRRFLGFCVETGTPDWGSLSVETIVEFVRQAATKTGHGRSAPAVAVRSFLRFLAVRGVVAAGMDRAIPALRHWRHASLPSRLTATQVNQLMAAIVDDPAARRDRAILLLLSRLVKRRRISAAVLTAAESQSHDLGAAKGLGGG